MSSNAVPGAIPLSGSPAAGSYTQSQTVHLYFSIILFLACFTVARLRDSRLQYKIDTIRPSSAAGHTNGSYSRPKTTKAVDTTAFAISKIRENYTSPEKPMKAIASMAAVMSATGVPFSAAGTPSSSRRSRIPANITSASPKPMAVDTE